MSALIERNETESVKSDVGSALRSPRPTHSAKSLICRICFDNETKTNRLIRPCSCSGSVAYVHNECLERWVRATSNVQCTICRDEFELIPNGLKHWKDMTLPRPMSNDTEDYMEFGCTVAWMIYMARFVYIGMKYGSRTMIDTVDAAIGTGTLKSVWWFSFWFNFLYYGAMSFILYDKWLVDNTVFSFKNRDADDVSVVSTKRSARTSGRSELVRKRALMFK